MKAPREKSPTFNEPALRSRLPGDKRSGGVARAFTWGQFWFSTAAVAVALVVGLVTRDITLIVLAAVGGFAAFLTWAVLSSIDE